MLSNTHTYIFRGRTKLIRHMVFFVIFVNLTTPFVCVLVTYDTIRYDSVYLTCSKKLTGSQLSPPHGTNKKLNAKLKMVSPVTAPRDLSVYIDADGTMRTHGTNTVRACFAAHYLLRNKVMPQKPCHGKSAPESAPAASHSRTKNMATKRKDVTGCRSSILIFCLFRVVD